MVYRPLSTTRMAIYAALRCKNDAEGRLTVRPSAIHAEADGYPPMRQRLAASRPGGRGWHSLRRKFAKDLMNQPLKVLCELGGWKTAKTAVRCYQRG